jgi:polyferredoxin
MTPDETDARIAALEARLAALGQQQDARNRHWLIYARVARIATLVLAILAMASAIGSIFTQRTDPLTPIFGLTMMVALFLTLAFTGPLPRQSA